MRELRPQQIVAACLALLGWVGCGARTELTDWLAAEASDRDSSVPTLPPAELALGSYHSCAWIEEPELYCWGWNYGGMVGDGSEEPRFEPVRVHRDMGFVHVVAGGAHSCLQLEDASVWCWGQNGSWQLGDGMGGTSEWFSSSPVEASGVPGTIVEIALGSAHSCAIVDDGTLWCWGYNLRGQLGDGSTAIRRTAEQISGLGAVAQVAPGSLHTCALLEEDGAVYCWGRNDLGQCADPSGQDVAEPARVPGLSRARRIVSGGNHSCAELTRGAWMCWGANRYGQLGGGAPSVAGEAHPVEVTVVSDMAHLALGYNSSCALHVDGSIECFGSNRYGQLGDGTFVDRADPLRAVALEPAVSIDAGLEHVCALTRDLALFCWGESSLGQMGVAEGRYADPMEVVLPGREDD